MADMGCSAECNYNLLPLLITRVIEQLKTCWILWPEFSSFGIEFTIVSYYVLFTDVDELRRAEQGRHGQTMCRTLVVIADLLRGGISILI